MIEDIRATANMVTFTDRDRNDFTATVSLTLGELRQLLAAVEKDLDQQDYSVARLTAGAVKAWCVIYKGKAYGFGDGPEARSDANNQAHVLVRDIQMGDTHTWDEWKEGTASLNAVPAVQTDELEQKHHPGYQHAHKARRCIYRNCPHVEQPARKPLTLEEAEFIGADYVGHDAEPFYRLTQGNRTEPNR